MSYSITRTCPSCGKQNRVPARHLADTGRCGACKAALPPLDQPLHVETGAFDDIIRESRVPVLADFWATWCGPCRIAEPEVNALAREMAGRAVVLKVDTEQHPELAQRFRIQGIPTFIVFRSGQVVLQQAGVVPRSVMRQWMQQAA